MTRIVRIIKVTIRKRMKEIEIHIVQSLLKVNSLENLDVESITIFLQIIAQEFFIMLYTYKKVYSELKVFYVDGSDKCLHI